MNPLIIKTKRLVPDAQLPKYVRPGDAGLDLHSMETRTLEQGEPWLFKTGIAMEIPPGFVGLIKERSGLGAKGIVSLGGVIDCTYRGDIGVILVNTSDKEYLIRPGDRIAQLLILPIATAQIEEAQELSVSVRADNGFGSSGR